MGKKFASVLVPVVLAVFLILVDGCGAYNPNGTGSGGTGGSTSDPGAAQGFYDCTVQQGVPDMEALILPTDVFYGMLGTLAPSSFTPSAIVTGQGASGTTTYAGNLTEFLPSGGTSSSTVTATDVPSESMSGTITQSGVQAGFGGSFLPTGSYTYSTPASITTIAGVWTGKLLDGNAVTLSISTSGSIATTSTGCQVTGTVTANTTDNYFTVNLRFGPTPGCVTQVASQNATAVAVVFLLPDNATTQLLMPATLGTTAATVFYAAR